MSKKDYIAIAKILQNFDLRNQSDPARAKQDLVEAFATYFAETNLLFDKTKFLEATKCP